MHFGGIHFTALPAVPEAEYPTPTAAYVPTTNRYIQGSDTVAIRSYENCPRIVGRVLAVMPRHESIPQHEKQHPHLIGRELTRQESLIRIQWHMSSLDYEWTNRFHPRDTALRRACGNIGEVLSTNCIVWISSTEIHEMVQFIHADDCKNQVFGPVHNRNNTYIIRQNIVCTNGIFDLIPIEQNNYQSYQSASVYGPPATATERILEFHLQEHHVHTGLLTKGRNLGNMVSIIRHLSREHFEYLQHQLERLALDDDEEDDGG